MPLAKEDDKAGKSAVILSLLLYYLHAHEFSHKQQKEQKKPEDNQLAKSVKDRYLLCWSTIILHVLMPWYSSKIAAEAQHGLIAQVLKDVIFSRRPGLGSPAAPGPQTAERVAEVVDATMS